MIIPLLMLNLDGRFFLTSLFYLLFLEELFWYYKLYLPDFTLRAMKAILEFLLELKQNNNREWFAQHKDEYLHVQEIHHLLLNEVIEKISQFNPIIGKPEAKDCAFRIYRDIRFSKDKLPYKTHIGAYIAREGRKSPRPGYYLHLEPGNSMIGGGIYMPQPDVLKRIRNEIYFDSKGFRSVLNDHSFSKLFNNLYEDKLTRNPKDFDPDFSDIELLRYKSYFVERYLSDEEILSDNFVNTIIDTCKVILPFHLFLNRAFE